MKTTATQLPDVPLATQDYVMHTNRDTEGRIEKAFHEQTRYLSDQQQRSNERLDSSFRWMIGMWLTTMIVMVTAVLFGA